jgi:hypothetical protein
VQISKDDGDSYEFDFRLYGAASASVNDKMYVLGGVDHTKTIKKTVLEYDPYRDSWLVLAEMANEMVRMERNR